METLLFGTLLGFLVLLGISALWPGVTPPPQVILVPAVAPASRLGCLPVLLFGLILLLLVGVWGG